MQTRPLPPEGLPDPETLGPRLPQDPTLVETEPGWPRELQGCAEWALVRYIGRPLGEVLSLRGPVTVLGRSQDNDICLEEEEVSRRHASLEIREDGTVALQDLGSTNGTFVNGRRLLPEDRLVILADGDVVRLGSHAFKLKHLDEVERAFHDRMLSQTTRDALTGVSNRATVLAFLEKQVELARRHHRTLSLILVDLDHFKDLNDAHGHGAGDVALKRFGTLALRRLRASDHAGRIGGEEFLVVLPETSSNDALQIAEDLRQRLEQEDPGPGLPRFTASFGVAQMRERDGDVGALLARADVALYRAKAQGRNRVACDEAL